MEVENREKTWQLKSGKEEQVYGVKEKEEQVKETKTSRRLITFINAILTG